MMIRKRKQPSFNLLRYFLVASLVALVIVAIMLGGLYSKFVLNDLITLAESKKCGAHSGICELPMDEICPVV